MNQNYTPKNLVFDEEGRKKLKSGIDKIVKAVKSTLGPFGSTVLIESEQHTHGIHVSKDGVTVARSISLIDPIENLAVRMIKEAAERTASSSGDGTSTSCVLAEALVNAGFEHIKEGVNKTEVLRELVELTKGVVKNLKSNSRAVTKGKLKDVATISANNDKVIGDIIAKVYKEVGKDGLVTFENSQTTETHFKTTNGIKIDRGYSASSFVNNQERDECIMNDAYVLVCGVEISNYMQLETILKPIITDKKPLLIIAPCTTQLVNTFGANVIKNGVRLCVVSPPSFGYKSDELMQDIAISVGATYFSEKTGDDLSHIQMSDLGMVSKATIDRESTILVKEEKKVIQRDGEADEAFMEREAIISSEQAELKGRVDKRIAELKVAAKNANKKDDKDFILSRIASLTGGVGVIHVGGKTDLEQKELYDRVEDAVCAVRSALEEGILPGGGVALYNEGFKLAKEGSIAGKMLWYALQQPLSQIHKNAEIEKHGMMDRASKPYNEGFDVKNKVWGDMYDMGVVDPTKVVRTSLENAVSVAVTILSTDSIITLARSYESGA